MGNKIAKLGLYLPHIYFIIICCIIAANPNFIMIGITVLLTAMIFLKNKILNVGVAAFLLFFSFWMMLAYISDLGDITVMTTKAWKFIVVGGFFVTANFIFSIMMGFPFFKEQVEMSSSNNSRIVTIY